MMAIVYRFLVILVKGLFPLVNLFIKKGKSKQFIEAQLKGIPSSPLPKSGKRFWFHCASLGEFEQARPLIESIKSKDSTSSIVVSFFSPSGYMQRHSYSLADAVLYLPIDSPKNAKNLLEFLQVDVAIFVKYEIWYFYLKALFKQGTPVFLISAVFRKKQFLFSFLGRFLFKLLPKFSGIYVQDSNSFEILNSKKLKNVFLSGDTRYDRVKQLSELAQKNERIEKFKSGKQLIILGSSWPEEERIFHAFYQKNNNNNLKVIIAPHDISDGHIKDILNRFSDYNPQLFTDENTKDSNVMVLNTIGHLASAYLYADMALIGGAFGKGLHNILEALSYGVPVAFGPNTQKYPEAALALEAGVAKQIIGIDDFGIAVEAFLNPALIDEYRSKCKNFIEQNSGATELVVAAIEKEI